MNTLWLVLTRKCNFDCSYCYQGSHSKLGAGLSPFMTQEVEDAGLRFALDWAEDDGLTLNLYGGEPLLYHRRGLWPMIAIWRAAFEARGKRLNIGITTNGSLMDAEVRENLDRFGISVLMSLDGPKHLHDQSRRYYDTDPRTGRPRGTWDTIPVEEIAAWSKTRKNPIEIAWQLSPQIKATPADLDQMLELFEHVNFNIQWLEDWPPESRIWLEEFFRGVYRRYAQKKIRSNWTERLQKVLTSRTKMEVPCGTGLRMLALTPEGWLYPSQEMAFSAVEPGRAPGTAEHYRVGNVFHTPVIDEARLADVSKIKTAQMKPPPPYDCDNCVAKPVSIGGCHCRYVGQDGMDPANRFSVAPGYCPSMISLVTGMLQGAVIERLVAPVQAPGTVAAGSGGLIPVSSLLRRPAQPQGQDKRDASPSEAPKPVPWRPSSRALPAARPPMSLDETPSAE